MEVDFSASAARTIFNPVQRVYVFYGEDDTRKDEAISQLRSVAIDESFSDFDCEVMDAENSGVEDILASAGSAPFGSPVRLVIVKGAEIYRKREKASDAERLASGIADLGSASCLALRVAAAEDEKSRGKTILNLKLDKAIKAIGCTVHCRPLSEQGLIDWMIAEAKTAGKDLMDNAAVRLIAAAHGDRTALRNELEKAICYAADFTIIWLEDAEAVSSYDPEDVMFQLVDSTCQRKPDRALFLLHELLRYDPKPQSVAGRLLALLTRQLRLIWQARELGERRIQPMGLKNLPEEIGAELPTEGSIVSMAWKARDLFAQARLWSRDALVKAFEMLIECDMANKGGEFGSEDVVTNLELLIIKLGRTA